MCLAVYIASDHPLSLTAWDQSGAALGAGQAVFYLDNPVRLHVSKPLIYSVGPRDGGCGCAFLFGVSSLENDEGEYDEAFTRSLAWERTPLLYSFERGNRDSVFYEITEAEASQIVERIRRIVAGGE